MSSNHSKLRTFTSIPQDILTPIFHLIDQSDRCSISCVCKVLRDVSRPTRFQDVQLHSKKAFDELCNLVREEEYAYCAKFVQEMTLYSTQTLSQPFPRLFPQLKSLSVHCNMDMNIKLSRTFLASLGELKCLRSLTLGARALEGTKPEDFSSLKLTRLVVSTEDASGISFCKNILQGATQESIAGLAIRISDRASIYDITDAFPDGIEIFPALQDLRLHGIILEPKFLRYPTLLPALSTFHFSPLVRGPLHDGKVGAWGSLENLVVSYNEALKVEDKILEYAPNIKEVSFRGLTIDSLHNVFLSIANAGTNVLHLTSISLQMVMFDFNTIVKENVLESAFSAMKNLEHFSLLGYAHSIARVPFRWFTHTDRLAKMLSKPTALRSLRTNLTVDGMEFLADKPEAVPAYVESKKEMYMTKTKVFFANCPTLQVVTWGFGAGAKRWWHIPAKRRGTIEAGDASSLNIDDRIYISSNAVFDRSEFR